MCVNARITFGGGESNVCRSVAYPDRSPENTECALTLELHSVEESRMFAGASLTLTEVRLGFISLFVRIIEQQTQRYSSRHHFSTKAEYLSGYWLSRALSKFLRRDVHNTGHVQNKAAVSKLAYSHPFYSKLLTYNFCTSKSIVQQYKIQSLRSS
jgi:hypothetical protein